LRTTLGELFSSGICPAADVVHVVGIGRRGAKADAVVQQQTGVPDDDAGAEAAAERGRAGDGVAVLRAG
jgi:hypothetical protein